MIVCVCARMFLSLCLNVAVHIFSDLFSQNLKMTPATCNCKSRLV
jgi:hypothetical protein